MQIMEVDTIKIGYAGINLSIDASTNKRCMLKNASENRLRELIAINLKGLKSILKYNRENNIKMFRISSGVIPFGSHPVNKLKWWQEFHEEFMDIKKFIKHNSMRVSMHPGQYTVLNSSKKDVVKNAIKDLEYHCKFLDTICDTFEHKIILHVGGVYGDKETAIQRFINNYNNLSLNIKNRLVIENDEKNYSIDDTLYISKKTGIPVVFDNLHNEINGNNHDIRTIINRCRDTWEAKDGLQKIHYSQQNLDKQPGAHSETIDTALFTKFIEIICGIDLDIMLEVKDKNKSAEKIISLLKLQ